MFRKSKYVLLAIGLAAGLAGGLMLAGLWPHTPLGAVATDRHESFAMCTGALDDDIEAVYFLDFLTGDLRAYAVSRQTGKFNARFTGNVAMDMSIDPSKHPQFMMVTGVADMRRGGGGRVTPSKSILYVAEITSGKVVAYAIPWSPGMHAAGQPIQAPLRALDIAPFRTAAAPGSDGPRLKGG